MTKLDNPITRDAPRGMHMTLLRHLNTAGSFDLRKVSEATRQRLIDLAMMEPPLVEVDADQVCVSPDGLKKLEQIAKEANR